MLKSSAGKGFRVFKTNTRKGFLDFQDHFRSQSSTTDDFFSFFGNACSSDDGSTSVGFCLQGPGGGQYMPAFTLAGEAFCSVWTSTVHS